MAFDRQRVELPDGDFVDVDWAGGNPADGPIVLLLHGLEGSSDSSYVRGLLRQVQRRGWRGGVMHFRGCSGAANRLPRGYHSGDSNDIAYLVDQLKQRQPDTPVAVVGYSLGGNVLLKWLGQRGDSNPLDAAVAVSVPFDLHAAADRLQRGLSRLYQRHLLTRLRQSVRDKLTQLDGEPPIDPKCIDELHTFRAFDDAVTAPLHGFAGVDDYYTQCSSRQYLGGIARPTLIIHARNDPFMTPAVIPRPDELSSSIQMIVTDDGGHVGFVSGRWPWRPVYWLEHRIVEYLAATLPCDR